MGSCHQILKEKKKKAKCTFREGKYEKDSLSSGKKEDIKGRLTIDVIYR